jgi:hypothetical protein
MRVLLLLAVSAFVPVPAAAADFPTRQSPEPAAKDCPRTASYLADKTGVYSNRPLAPRKLTELPPATAYMAVYRHIGQCEAPLTMSAYRNPRQRARLRTRG